MTTACGVRSALICADGVQFTLDFFLILKALPDPIRGLLRANWLNTCGPDAEIGNTNIPCVENMVLVVALCFPVFLVTVFDTGILYQVAVFLYGCTNGLFVQKLGQIVSWNDLIVSVRRPRASRTAVLWTTVALCSGRMREVLLLRCDCMACL